jgi:hypothetical protein
MIRSEERREAIPARERIFWSLSSIIQTRRDIDSPSTMSLLFLRG